MDRELLIRDRRTVCRIGLGQQRCLVFPGLERTLDEFCEYVRGDWNSSHFAIDRFWEIRGISAVALSEMILIRGFVAPTNRARS